MTLSKRNKISKGLVPSVGKNCSKCSRENLSFMHTDYLCDYCFFGDHERFPRKNMLTSITTTNIWDILKAIFSMLFLIFLIWWTYMQVQGIKGEPECAQGDNWEEDSRGIV